MSDIIDAVLELAGDITFLTEDGLIDRKSVIDFLSGIENLDPKTKGSIVMYIESLPAVHPNHIADIGKKASISDNHENDCISRQAAIDIVRDKCKRIPTCAILAMDAIAKLPVALPEPKSPQNGSFDFEQPEIKSDRTTDDCISREAAIEALDEWFKKATRHPLSMSEYDSAYAQGEIDAYVTAIDTLKTLPSAQPDHVADVSKKVSISCGQENDLISRQMAIDALDKRFDDVPMELTTEILQLRRDLRERIPSAQPATSCSEIPNSSTDCISRQAAIDVALEDVSDKRTHEFNAGAIRAVNRIKSLPSAQPETAKRIVGKSRDGMTLWYQCDMCNEPVHEKDEFCPGCGRRLTDG